MCRSSTYLSALRSPGFSIATRWQWVSSARAFFNCLARCLHLLILSLLIDHPTLIIMVLAICICIASRMQSCSEWWGTSQAGARKSFR